MDDILATQYQQALDYLYSFVDYSLTRAFRYSPEKFDLSRMAAFLELLGNPHLKYPVIHVAGTKGKGSTSALIASALRAAGYKTGLYTSPHLLDYTERMQVNGEPIPAADFVSLVDEIKPHVQKIDQLTTFEITTALGFLFFNRQSVDTAVVEVGMGGRLDATNLVSPLVTVITSISMDHMAVLGNTLAQIAAEKGGIIKTGRPVVLAPQRSEAGQVLRSIAAERKAPLCQVGDDLLYTETGHALDGQTFLVWNRNEQKLLDAYIESDGKQAWKPLHLKIPLLGYHQVQNAATAYAALKTARKEGLEVSDVSIQRGFESVVWPGRFEVLRRSPVVVIDSAHNPDSALKLRLTIDDYFPGKPALLVFGASEDKNIEEMFESLLPRVQQVITTQSIHPRAADANKLVELVHRYGKPARAMVPVEDALQEAIKRAEQQNSVVVVAGSLFLAAAARQILDKTKFLPEK
jgi:dihydrofolate synthase/folylpolyglutamate synthase